MNLYLIRHAIAADSVGITPDSERPLTTTGREKLAAIARRLAELEVKPDLIISSTYLRACQTADMLAGVLGYPLENIQRSENLTPYAVAEKLVEELVALQPLETLLLVGHEPLLSGLAGLLLAGDGGMDLTLKKAGVIRLSVAHLVAGRCATLEWLLPPALMVKN